MIASTTGRLHQAAQDTPPRDHLSCRHGPPQCHLRDLSIQGCQGPFSRSALCELFVPNSHARVGLQGTWRIRIEFFLDTPPIIDPVSASSKRLAQLQSQSVDSTGRRTSVPLIGNEGASKKSAPIAARRVSTGTHPPAQHKLKAAARYVRQAPHMVDLGSLSLSHSLSLSLSHRNAANFTTATATKNVSAPAATTMAHQMTGGDISALLNIIPCPAVNKIRVMHRKREQVRAPTKVVVSLCRWACFLHTACCSRTTARLAPFLSSNGCWS